MPKPPTAIEKLIEALAAFDENIAVSRDRGWSVTYNGTANFG